MHFYRRWQPVAAISFDLDDTLYDNGPAIVRAEQWMLSHLRSEYLATAMLDKPRWLELKRAVLLARPELRHDVSLARQQTIRAAMVEGGDGRPAGQSRGGAGVCCVSGRALADRGERVHSSAAGQIGRTLPAGGHHQR